jgi:predicted DNA-binding transcriptional regulator YafY
MSSSEIVALTLGLDLLREDSLELENEQRMRIDALSSKLREQIGFHISIAASPTTSHRSVVSTSIARRVPVDLTYYSTNSDEETQRIVTVYDFFLENEVEYFQGYCHTSSGMRTFRVDRIVSVALSDSEEGVPQAKVEKTESVRVGATVRSLDRASAEAFGLAFSDLRPGESVTLAAFSQEWLVRMIFAGAGSLVIEDPHETRLLLRQSIDATMALYE